MAEATRWHTAKLKFQVALEALRGEKSLGQIARAYGLHPNTIGIWKQSGRNENVAATRSSGGKARAQ